MDLNDLTIGDAKELAAMFGKSIQADGLDTMLGQKLIVRTYSAGVWFGTLEQKSRDEVILKNARRMWRWQAAQSISLSGCAIYGIDAKRSKIVEAVPSVWLQAIELIPCTAKAVQSIEEAPHVAAE